MHSSTIFSLLEGLTGRLLPALQSREIARSYAWQLLTTLFTCDRATLCARTTIQLTIRQQELLESWIDEIVRQHKPIAYIIGSVPFLDLQLTIRPPILIPRPETEWWCELLINALRGMPNEKFTLVDLCTGSGCIALAVAKKFPKSMVWGTDISPEAIELARENRERNNLRNCRFVESDLFAGLPRELRIDIITANPPYIDPMEYASLDPSVKNWEDQTALVAEDSGLAVIKKIAAQAPAYLIGANRHIPPLWLEIGAAQKESTSKLPVISPFTRLQVALDLTGKARLLRFYC